MYTKERYSSPDCEIINLKIEGVICASDLETGFDPTFGDPFNEEQNWQLMKKITLLTIFGLALMALSACNKEEVTASRTLKLDLNIIHDSDTKAVKTGWESGDKIYVFFGKPTDHTTPAYLTLTFDGSSWTEGWTAGLEAEIASTESGKLHAVYTPGKLGTMSYSTYLKTYQFFDGDTGWYLKCEKVSYTVSEGVLAATLNMARPSNFVQFYLEGQAANAGKLQFSGDKILKVEVSGLDQTGFGQGNYNYGRPIDGVAYKGGLMFSGLLKEDASGVEASHTLTITDTKGTRDTKDDVVYTTKATKTMKYGDAFVLPALNTWTVTP